MLIRVALPICLKTIDFGWVQNAELSPLRRCLSDCLWDCLICKTRPWKWPHPLQSPRWEISLGSRGTDDYTQIGIVSCCFSCQNESEVQHSVLVSLQSCPPIYQEQRDKRFYMFVAICLVVIHDGSLPSRNLCQQAWTQLTMPAEDWE